MIQLVLFRDSIITVPVPGAGFACMFELSVIYRLLTCIHTFISSTYAHISTYMQA